MDDMILTILGNGIIAVIGVILSTPLTPEVTSINIDLSSVGLTAFVFPIDDYLSTGMGYVVFLMDKFPPLYTVYLGFTFVLVWRATLMFLRGMPILGRIIR